MGIIENLVAATELSQDWWVLALLGALVLLMIVAIVFMFTAAFGGSEKKEQEPEQDEQEPEQEPEEEQPDRESEEIAEEEQEQPDEEEEEDEGSDDDEDDKDVIIPPTVATTEYTTVYNKSFMARLSQSSDELKARYNEIKNHILSYKKVKGRVSWSFDSFNSGRNKLIRIQCKGKNLAMYIALDPASVDPKYRVKDMSEVSRYREVPTMIKIKSDRSLKYAKELVDKIMADKGLVAKPSYEAVDFTVPYMETEELIANGLIKTRETVARPFYR